MSSGVSGFSTILVWNFHRILEMTGISGPSESMSPVDVTNHESPDSFREFVAGPRSGGEVSVEGNFIKADANGQVNLHTDIQAGTMREVWVVMPMAVGGALKFNAFATGFSIAHPYEDKISTSGALQITGKPEFYDSQSAGISAMTGIEENGGSALSISPSIDAGVYEYACTVNTASTWVKLTVTAASHTIKVQGVTQTSGVQGGEIALGAAGTTTEIFIMVYEANKAPRLYVLTVTRPSS